VRDAAVADDDQAGERASGGGDGVEPGRQATLGCGTIE
jgi:hypothetical protein